MTDEQSVSTSNSNPQTGSRYNETFSPVILTDTVGAVFLGLISFILIIVLGVLLIRNRKLEERLRELVSSAGNK
jgi:uncharacterized protein (DUF2062 family)